MAKSGCIQCDRLRRELADAYAQRDKAIQAASDLRNAQNYGELLRENTRLLEELVNMKKGKPPVAAPPDAMERDRIVAQRDAQIVKAAKEGERG